MKKTILALATFLAISTSANALVVAATEYNYDNFKGHYLSTGLVYTPDGKYFVDGWAQGYNAGSNTVSGYEFGTGFRPSPTSALRLGYGTMGGESYILASGEYTYWINGWLGVYGGASHTFARAVADTNRIQGGLDFSLGNNFYTRVGYSYAKADAVKTKSLVWVVSKVFE